MTGAELGATVVSVDSQSLPRAYKPVGTKSGDNICTIGLGSEGLDRDKASKELMKQYTGTT